jgi:ubiquinone/menaquinone biosynthesis C-methylase UbiE
LALRNFERLKKEKISMSNKNFWEDANHVENFTAKAADHRLVELVKQYPSPKNIKVLDLGCAAGRNTIFLAESGFDVWAVDSSKAMIEKTQNSLAPFLDSDEIEKRIKVRKMDNISWAENNSFDLIIALGILHNAQSEDEFNKSLSESQRILKLDGKLLVANFSPGTNLPNMNLVKESGHIWNDKRHGNLYLLTATELDEKMKEFVFFPVTKTVTVEKLLVDGKRVTVNALYEKREG